MRKDDHAGCTFALLGESDRVRCHSGLHPAICLPGQPTSVINRRKLTLNGELRSGEQGSDGGLVVRHTRATSLVHAEQH